MLAYYGTDGDPSESGTKIIITESGRRLGKTIEDGWIIFDYWVYKMQIITEHLLFLQADNVFHPRLFIVMLTLDTIMSVSFMVAATLGGLTFYYIIREKQKISKQARTLQLKLFIIVCAQVGNIFKVDDVEWDLQTFVPLVFVYIPYFCVINLAFFKLPVFMDTASVVLASCFPAWDAVIMMLMMKDYRWERFIFFYGRLTVENNKKAQNYQ